MMLKNCIKKDLCSLINLKITLITISSFFIISMYSYSMLTTGSISKAKLNIFDIFLINFLGPCNNTIMDFLKWFLPIILFMFFIGNFFYKEWQGRYLYSLIRTKSLSQWLLSKIISISIFSFLYCITFYIVTLIVGLLTKLKIENCISKFASENILLNGTSSWSVYKITMSIFILLFLGLIVLSLIVLNFSLFNNESIYGYLFICLIVSEPLINNIIPNSIIPWLLGEQLIFFKHSITNSALNNFTVQWSICYLLILGLLSIYLSFIALKKKDFR
ncbi:membrane protein [Clostridium botulinum]|uniref:membrane protein n=1 Tax=Clostridium botulinum TaxID=1491 RepID=UPI0004D6C31F|nr:membrane protein [Clostridium botulinum]KEI01344.1 membrane protein [Clostridium botulinum C/D str. BKT75002]